MKRKIIYVFLFLSSVFTYSQEDITGIWQDSPVMASGWTDNYQIFSDGRFIFNYSQMDCDNRLVSYHGTWEIIGTSIFFTVNEITIISGGKLIKSVGSCGSQFMLVDGMERQLKLENPFVERHDFKIEFVELEGLGERKALFIDEKMFFRMAADPSDYY